MALHVVLVVALDVGQVVDVVHHQAERLRHALRRTSAAQLMRSSRAPLPRWKRATGSSAWPSRHSRVRYQAASASSARAASERGARRATLAAPAQRGSPESARGSRRLEVRQLRMQVRRDLLDEEVAERDAAQARLAAGDRVEHRAARRARIAHRALEREDRRHRRRQLVHERDLDEDERLVGQRGMEEARSSGGRAPGGASGPGSRWISCTASYSISFSRIAAGVRQSMRRSSRKPRLNHELSRCVRSWSTTASCGCSLASPPAARFASRTSAAVPPGAMFMRRKTSWRGGSATAAAGSGSLGTAW